MTAIGGAVVFVASFVPWYRSDRWNSTDRYNGWQEPDAILSQGATVLAVATAIAIGLAASGAIERLRLGTWSWGTLLTGAGAVVTGLVLLKLALNLELTTVGIYLSLTGGAAMLYGGYVTRMDEPDDAGAPPPRPAEATATSATATPATAETAHLLAAHLETAAGIPEAAASYLQAFDAEPDRVARVAAELQQVLIGPRPAVTASELVQAHAPRWAGLDAVVVLSDLRRRLLEGPAT